jgi:predicted transcriptional regulator
MAQAATPAVHLYRVARIVSSYLRHHQLGPDQLGGLIGAVHRALPDLLAQKPRHVQRSVQRYYVVCLECGFHAQALRRHLRVQHGLEVAAYRTRRNLPSGHVMTAPAYSTRRSAIAKQIGFGRRRAPVEPPPPPRRRRRSQPAPEN